MVLLQGDPTMKHSYLYITLFLIVLFGIYACSGPDKSNTTQKTANTQTQAEPELASFTENKEFVQQEFEQNQKRIKDSIAKARIINVNNSITETEKAEIEEAKAATPKKSSLAPAKQAKKTKRKPRKKRYAAMTFDVTEYDFGEITEGDIVNYKFQFKNTGDVPLSISEANASCGCTRPDFPFIDIPPGETHYIGVTFNSVSKEGFQRPEITIKANTNPSITKLYLSGDVLLKEKEKPAKKEIRDTVLTLESTDSTAIATPAKQDTSSR